MAGAVDGNGPRSDAAMRVAAGAGPAWHQMRERGSRLALELALQVVRIFGYRFMHAMLHPIALYFQATSPRFRQVSRTYFQRVQGRCGVTDSYRQAFLFAESNLERIDLALHGPAAYRLERPGFAAVERLAARGRGGVFLGAHVGSLEVARQLNPTRIRTVPVGYPAGAQMFREILLRAGMPRSEELAVGEAGSVGFMLEARRVAARGDFLGMLGDRALPGAPRIEVPFLGVPVRFPSGPYRLAGGLRCPLVMLFAVRTAPRAHVLHARVLSEEVVLPRRGRDGAIRELVARYVHELERVCRRWTHQWYNFHDVWAEDRTG